MDPEIDGLISEHVLRMHRYRSAKDGGDGLLDASSQYGTEEGDAGASVFVKYNRMLHGKKTDRGQRNLSISYFYSLFQASEQLATAYAELRNGSSNAKNGGGTLPMTARTLETIIRLSTAHAKLKLNKKVLKSDVESALGVLNFAIYHKELNEMEEREQERNREFERKRKAYHDDHNERGDSNKRRSSNIAHDSGFSSSSFPSVAKQV